MAQLETLFEKIKALPPEEQERVAEFVRVIVPLDEDEELADLMAGYGSLRGDVAADWLKAMDDCEQIDEAG